jgi:rubrerythrin
MINYVALMKDAQKRSVSRDNTVSVKDLTLCHRKKVFSKMYPTQPTDEELYEYVSEQAGHDNIQRLFMMFAPNRFRLEMEVQYEHIRGRIDVYDKLFNNVVDIKTSKSQRLLLKPFKFHQKQVRDYMAMVDSDEGHLIYQMNNFGMYVSFPIYMTAEERKKTLEELKSEAESLRNAIDAGDPSHAKGIYDDSEMSWMCNKCQYLEKCKAIRHLDYDNRNAIGIDQL